ncbi:MAG: hypothetical protein K2L13_00560 [Opitutales bacterium]|nr:hypothetical protein [Opitutales bacterium]
MVTKSFWNKSVRVALSLCFAILFPIWCLGVEVGDTFEIDSGNFVPLFMTEGVNLKYDIGSHGNNCYDLDTVLPPETFVKVDSVSQDQDTVHVICKVSENCCFKGFVHKHFLEDCASSMAKSNFDAQSPKRDIMSVREICDILDDCIEKNMPYSYGCNNFEELQLAELYSFEGPSADCQPYHCVGFDCSGLLHYISSWTLPHSTKQLYNSPHGKCILSLDVDASDAELKKALSVMKDTDYVVFIHDYQYTGGSGHVIVSLHGGFVEAVGQNVGIVFTPRDAALKRLRKLLGAAHNNGAKDVKIIRWHPDLLTK